MMTNNLYLLGPEFSYHYFAAKKFLDFKTSYNDIQLRFTQDFDQIFKEVDSGNLGIIAIYNNTSGIVENNYEKLQNYSVVAHIHLAIQHTLIIHPDATLKGVTHVLLHTQVEKQCSNFLDKQNWIRIYTSSTSQGAHTIAEKQTLNTATLANKEVALELGLKIVEIRAMNSNTNITSFVVFTI